MKHNEEQLIERVRRRESEAQRELYETYAGRLMAITLRYVGKNSVAEDVMHDAIIKIFNSIDKFKYRGEGSIRAWMERVTINTALGWLRSQKRDLLLDEGRIPDDLACDEPSSSDVSAIPQDKLLEMVSELPDGYRTVFNLFCIEGYSHREIAKELGINEKSSSSQLLRARRLLASRINEYMKYHE